MTKEYSLKTDAQIGRAIGRKIMGGEGSGYFGHSGRPGEVGGSGEGEVAVTKGIDYGKKFKTDFVSKDIGSWKVKGVPVEDISREIISKYDLKLVRSSKDDEGAFESEYKSKDGNIGLYQFGHKMGGVPEVKVGVKDIGKVTEIKDHLRKVGLAK